MINTVYCPYNATHKRQNHWPSLIPQPQIKNVSQTPRIDSSTPTHRQLIVRGKLSFTSYWNRYFISLWYLVTFLWWCFCLKYSLHYIFILSLTDIYVFIVIRILVTCSFFSMTLLLTLLQYFSRWYFLVCLIKTMKITVLLKCLLSLYIRVPATYS